MELTDRIKDDGMVIALLLSYYIQKHQMDEAVGSAFIDHVLSETSELLNPSEEKGGEIPN